MKATVFKKHVYDIIVSSRNEDEIRKRIRDELSYPHEVELRIVYPKTKADKETVKLARSLERPVTLGGASVSATLVDRHGEEFYL